MKYAEVCDIFRDKVVNCYCADCQTYVIAEEGNVLLMLIVVPSDTGNLKVAPCHNFNCLH